MLINNSEGLTPKRGLLAVNGAVLLFGLAGVLGKLSGLPAPSITLGRVVIAGPALYLFARYQKTMLRPLRASDAMVLVGQGALLALHWTAFFEAINVSNVAIGLLSFSSFPLFTLAFEPMLLRQTPSRVQALSACVIFAGIYLLVPTFSLDNSATVGILWGLLAGLTFALLSVVNRWLGRRYQSVMITFYQDGIAALVLLPTLAFTRVMPFMQWRVIIILLVLGLLCTALAHTLFVEGLRGVTAQLASVIASLEPVWGIVFALLLLGEVPTGRTLIGGAIIVLATLVPSLMNLRRSGATQPTDTIGISPSSVSRQCGQTDG